MVDCIIQCTGLKDAELLTAEPAGNRHVGCRHDLADSGKDRIASLMAMGIIDMLEMIEIEDDC